MTPMAALGREVDPVQDPTLSGPRTSTTQSLRAETSPSALNPDSYGCARKGFIDFEQFADGTNLTEQTLPGVHFTTTDGFTWRVGDFATGQYNGKYPNGAYTSRGTHWAWLGTSQSSGRIDFVEGKAQFFSLLTSSLSTMTLEAYGSNDELLVTATTPGGNTSSGQMDELRVERGEKDISYVIVHDSGNYFLIDAVCTDAPGVGLPPTNVAVTPRIGVSGSSFRFAYLCPASTAPSFRMTDAAGNTINRGITLGLAVSMNNREYVQGVEIRLVGVFFGVVTCGGGPAGAASVLVKSPSGRGSYVALGDSYSAGEGTRSYDTNATACHRGPLAWPRLLEQMAAELGPIEHKACTGAVTADLFRSQNGQPRQIPETANANVGLVTITIGGNDVDFAGILTACFFVSCAEIPEQQSFLDGLKTLTETLVADVYPALMKAYPNARIVHVGYPRLTPLPEDTPVNCGNWLQPDEQTAGQKLNSQLNGAIRAAADRQSRVEYLDVTNALDEHELCTASSWMHPINPYKYLRATEQGHPLAAGQYAYAGVVADALDISMN